ncbi:MAG: peptidylprolyl isomerase [Ilumatobacteraceae bacterium]
MGTEKRERQKANRQLKYEQQAKQVQRQRLTKRVIVGIVAAVVAVGFVIFLALAFGDSDDDSPTPATEVSTLSSDSTSGGPLPTVAVPELSGPTTPIEFTYGTGECPPSEGSAEPVTTFSDAPQQCIDPAATYTARFVTDRGDIVVDLDTTHSPGTVNNFVTLARFGYYDDTTIFRTNTSIDIIQGGGLTNTDSPGYEIPDEGTGYEYPPGVLAMARTDAPDSAGGQWFFTTGPNSAGLSGDGTYVVFGAVTAGSDIAAEINALAGPDGDTPTESVTLQRVEITES